LLVDARGRLVLIDFGLCAEIDRFDSNALTSAIVNLMRGDVEGLVEDAVALRFLPADVDREALLPPLRAVFERAQLAAATELRDRIKGEGARRAREGSALMRAAEDAAPAYDNSDHGGGRSNHRAVARRKRQFAAVSRDLNQIFFDFPFTVPEYFALITRALIVLEGIALTGDPDFDLFQSAYPYAARHAAALFGKRQLAQMLGEAKSAAAAAARNGEAATGVATESVRRPSRLVQLSSR
jgi:aarF domain-containing kinase